MSVARGGVFQQFPINRLDFMAVVLVEGRDIDSRSHLYLMLLGKRVLGSDVERFCFAHEFYPNLWNVLTVHRSPSRRLRPGS